MKKKSEFKKGVDFIGVTCVFFCHDGKGKFLMHKRSENCRDEIGNWDIGGGSLEFGEEFEEGVIREIQEEYGVTPKKVKLVHIYNALRENKGKKTHWVCLLFTAQVNPKKAKIGEPEAMDDIGWVTPNNLPSPLHTNFLGTLKTLKKLGAI